MPELKLVWYRGKWAAAWTEGGRTRRASLRTQDRGVAERRLASLQDDANKPKDGSLESIFAAYKAKKGTERLKYSWIALAPYWRNLLPDQITPERCVEYAEQRRKQGIQNGTIIRELTDLRSAVNKFARKAGAQFEFPPAPPPKDIYITKDEYREIRESARHLPHLLLFMELAIATGSRSIALVQLTWAQIDFQRRLINLGIGSGNKRRSTVPMTATVEKALKAAYQRRTCTHVIEYAGRPVKKVRKSFERACANAGHPEVTPHVLRHSVAIWMAEDRVPMTEISQYLGHTSTAVTERVYARYSPDYLRGAARSLEID